MLAALGYIDERFGVPRSSRVIGACIETIDKQSDGFTAYKIIFFKGGGVAARRPVCYPPQSAASKINIAHRKRQVCSTFLLFPAYEKEKKKFVHGPNRTRHLAAFTVLLKNLSVRVRTYGAKHDVPFK